MVITGKFNRNVLIPAILEDTIFVPAIVWCFYAPYQLKRWNSDFDGYTFNDLDMIQKANACLLAFMILEIIRWAYVVLLVETYDFEGFHLVKKPANYYCLVTPTQLKKNDEEENLLHGSNDGHIKARELGQISGMMNGFVGPLVALHMARLYHVQNGDKFAKMDERASSRIKIRWNEDEKICKVCNKNRGCVLIQACGHGGMCEDCAKLILNNGGVCPLCGGKAENMLLVTEGLWNNQLVSKLE